MKKGYIRTIEAVIAVVLIFIFLMSVVPRQKNEVKTPKEIETLQDKITSEIEINQVLRDQVLILDTISLDSFISEKVSTDRIGYKFTICNFETPVTCNPLESDLDLPRDRNVYAKSVMIASSTSKKIFRLYLWYGV